MHTVTKLSEFYPFFSQEGPSHTVVGLIANVDESEPYELDASAVFVVEDGFLVVLVCGCSCWPDRGSTTQLYCEVEDDVRKLLGDGPDGEDIPELLKACEEANWKPTILLERVEK